MKTSLLLSLLLGATVLPAQDSEFGEAVATTLTQVRAEPDAFKNVNITLSVQFASLGKISNPFFTRFTPSEFLNFYCWADEQPIWQKESYSDLFGMMFYSKVGPKLRACYELRLYERLKVTGVVRNTFQGTPWIEVIDFEPIGGQVDLAVLTHLYRGEQLMGQRRWQRAIAELSLAPGDDVPPAALSAVHRNLGVCFLRIGEVGRAVEHLQNAMDLAPANDFELARLFATASKDPTLEIDRTVDPNSLKDHERPMWDAFEGDRTRTTKLMQ